MIQRPLGASLVALAAISFAGAHAFAAPKDTLAQKLDGAAMNDDFLAVKFGQAEIKLRRALKECGVKDCAPKVKAQLYMHLGIILVNSGKTDAGISAFLDGLKIRPDAAPDKDFTSPEIDKAFTVAKEKSGGTSSATAAAPASDVKHEPVTEARRKFPIPIYVGTLPNAAKAVLYYQAAEDDDWSKARMKKMGKGWGGSIPCKATDDAGTLHYYAVVEDSDGEIIARIGTKAHPFSTQIKNKITGDPPAFPDQDPPSSCDDKDECAKDSKEPGCEAVALGAGEACTGPGQCSKEDGLACVEGTCQQADEEHPAEDDGVAKNMFTFGLSMDLAHVASGPVCSPGNYSNATFACFRQDGLYYKPSASGDAGTVGGVPFVTGTFRVLVGYDRIVTGNLAVGIRLGYAFNGGPAVPSSPSDKSFFPWHIEPRLTYWLGGDDVLKRIGFRPFAYLSGGFAEVDGKLPSVQVSNDCDAQALCRGPKTPQALAMNPDGSLKTHADGSYVFITPNGTDVLALPAKGTNKITVAAYRKLGTSFVGLGGGVMYAMSKSFGVTFDLKFAYFFGSPGIALSPTLGGAYSF
jgi:hypothetical protein